MSGKYSFGPIMSRPEILNELPSYYSNWLPHIYRVNHRLALYKRVEEPFIEAPNPYDEIQGWLKHHDSLFGIDLASRTHSFKRFGRHRR